MHGPARRLFQLRPRLRLHCRGLAAQPAALRSYLGNLQAQQIVLGDERELELTRLADYVYGRVSAGKQVRLNFICTHNSRRSHCGAIAAEAAATFFGVPSVRGCSGGTEATAFFPAAVAAVEGAGALVSKNGYADAAETNPVYCVDVGSEEPLRCFSKKYDDPSNPRKGYAAVMVCNHADASCPVVPGADERFCIQYDDPKAFDDAGEEAQQKGYQERLAQISMEMLFVFSNVKQRLTI